MVGERGEEGSITTVFGLYAGSAWANADIFSDESKCVVNIDTDPLAHVLRQAFSHVRLVLRSPAGARYD